MRKKITKFIAKFVNNNLASKMEKELFVENSHN
jgi:hypothetical protein